MRRRFTVRTGLEALGPLFDDPPAPPSGDPAPSGSGEPSKPGAGGAPPAPPAPAEPPAGNVVPYERFKEVNDELAKRRKADEEREAAEAAKRGEHEKLAANEKAKREEAEQKAASYARRLAFVTAATGKVSDIGAAHKLAAADGLLTFELDDEGNPKDPESVGKMIDGLVKTYAFLKPGPARTGPNFGADHGGTDGGSPVDPEKLTALQKMELGIKAGGR